MKSKVKQLMSKIYFPYLFSILCTLAILYLSLGMIPSPETGIEIPHLDKIVHFCMYFGYASILLLEIKKAPTNSFKLFVVLYTILFGILMEIFQSQLFTYRSGDYVDAIFNSIGSIMAVVLLPITIKITKPLFPQNH